MNDWAQRLAEKISLKKKREEEARKAAEAARRLTEAEAKEAQKREEAAKKRAEEKTDETAAEKNRNPKEEADQLWLSGVQEIIGHMDALSGDLFTVGLIPERFRFLLPPTRPVFLEEPLEIGGLLLPEGDRLILVLRMLPEFRYRLEYLQPFAALVCECKGGGRTEDVLLGIMSDGTVSPMMRGSFALSKIRRARSLRDMFRTYLESKLV